MRKKIVTFVHTLREQSHETRRIILVLGSFGLTALIMLAWVGSLGSRQAPDPVVLKNIEKKGQSPFSIIRDNVVELYANN